MNSLACVIIMGLLVQSSLAVIYHLPEDVYALMPPLFHLDPYEECIAEEGRYCSVTLQLVTDQPSELFTMIQEYSERSISHFNHTVLKHGICVTQKCRKYIDSKPQDQRWALEACFNESMYRDYGLKTRVMDRIDCHSKNEHINIDTGDVVVAAILCLLLTINIVGSLYEYCWMKGSKQGIHILTCFSIRRNVRRLLATTDGPDPRITRLKGIHGLKAITMFLVVGIHSLLPFLINIENPRYLEESYSHPGYRFISTGTPVVQTFFVLGGFLLAYNLRIVEEKYTLGWTTVLKGIIGRWLRLTPTYAVVLAVTATWLRHAGSGPLWDAAIVEESLDCRRYWWHQLLYINNYIDYSKCMPQMWYVACDFQMHIVGLVTCVLLAVRTRRVALAALLVFSMLANGAHTYWQDLDAVLVPSPEASRNFYFKDPTFIHTYKRMHTNLAAYAIGLALGLLVYHWQQTKYDIQKVSMSRFVYWLSAPLMGVLLALGGVFYMDRPREPAYIRAIYSMFAKPAVSMCVAVVIAGMVFQLETFYRGILEWRGWAALGRLAYCAYATHLLAIRWLGASSREMVHGSLFTATQEAVVANVVSFALAVPLYVLVEAPFSHLLRASPKQSEPSKTSQKPIADEKKTVNINNENNDASDISSL